MGEECARCGGTGRTQTTPDDRPPGVWGYGWTAGEWVDCWECEEEEESEE